MNLPFASIWDAATHCKKLKIPSTSYRVLLKSANLPPPSIWLSLTNWLPSQKKIYNTQFYLLKGPVVGKCRRGGGQTRKLTASLYDGASPPSLFIKCSPWTIQVLKACPQNVVVNLKELSGSARILIQKGYTNVFSGLTFKT